MPEHALVGSALMRSGHGFGVDPPGSSWAAGSREDSEAVALLRGIHYVKSWAGSQIWGSKGPRILS